MENLEITGPAPLVSVAIPLYNGKRFIRGCLDMLLAQTFTDYEIVIVDNGSTDGTSEICQEYARRDPRIRHIKYEGTIPIAQNFWRAFLHTRGRYFTWNSADDRRDPDTLALAVAEFERHPEAVLVHGPVELDIVADGTINIIANDFDASMPDAAVRVAAYSGGVRNNAIYFSLSRRDALARVTLRQRMGHDFLVTLQMAMIGPFRRIEKPIIKYWHVYGPQDDPMYAYRPLTIRKLLSWPENRFKCWIVLARGAWYLLREHQTPLATRIRCTAAFLGTFSRRYAGYLFREGVYAAAAPVACLLWPLSEPVRIFRRARLSRRNQDPQSTTSS
jgi:glycosyltransferase involved in cell wall biosynthesis